MRNLILLSVLMSVVIFGCANQQKDETEKSVEAETAITVPTEEVSLNVTGMV